MSEKILRRLKVLAATAEQERESIPTRTFFHIGPAEVLEPFGEVLPLLSWIDDNLGRFALSTAPSTSWGRIHPPPLVFSLPHRAIAVRDGLFIVTGPGKDRAEKHPDGRGTIHIVHLGHGQSLWSSPIAKAHIYRIDGGQSQVVAPVKV